MPLRWILLAAAVPAALWLLDLVIVTDAEEVEDTVERLVVLANQGGPIAAAEIDDIFARDYSGGVSKKDIDFYLTKYVAGSRIRSLRTGGVSANEKEGRFKVQLRVTAHTVQRSGTFLCTLFFAERDEGFQIVSAKLGW